MYTFSIFAGKNISVSTVGELKSHLHLHSIFNLVPCSLCSSTHISWFDSYLQIEFDLLPPIQITIFDLTEFLNSILLIISVSILLNFPNLIQLQLNTLEVPLKIRIRFSDSIWLIISYSIWLSYLIWFNTHCTYLTHHFQFDSDILIKFDSEFLIQFVSEFLIQFYSILRFDLTNTTFIWLAISNLNRILWLNTIHHIQSDSTKNFLFNLNHLYHLIWHTLHGLNSRFPIQLSCSDSTWLGIYDSIWLSFPIWFD